MKKTIRLHNRRMFLKSSAMAATGLSCWGLGLRAGPLAPGFLKEDLPHTHNMMVVGERTAYLSHLPMFVIDGRPAKFNSPHRFQVILEATFSDGTRDLTAGYFNDRAQHPAMKMYTLKPADFILSRLNPSGAALKNFAGKTLFRGHLERDGEPFIDFTRNRPPTPATFQVNVVRVVHFHEFDPRASKPQRLEYLLFGKGNETFLAHFITKPNDFDQIISVKIDGQPFTDAQLAAGMHVIFSNRANTVTERLKENDSLTGQFQFPGAPSRSLTVAGAREFYFEEGELAAPPSFDSTDSEKKAGFP
jgi:hypothetical protein